LVIKVKVISFKYEKSQIKRETTYILIFADGLVFLEIEID
jgi:hypothetical protein